jgi:2-oxoglutarate ferredoxin oxidoreductase subunit delta
VVNSDACIKCMLCELRCPEYAIVVGGEDDEQQSPVNAGQ